MNLGELENTLTIYELEYKRLKDSQREITAEMNRILNRIMNIESYLMDKEAKDAIQKRKSTQVSVCKKAKSRKRICFKNA